MVFPTSPRTAPSACPSERDTARALLDIKTHLRHMLRRPPAAEEQRRAWASGVSTLLIEAAHGRVYLARLRSAQVSEADMVSLEG
jgi:hypothetical protein